MKLFLATILAVLMLSVLPAHAASIPYNMNISFTNGETYIGIFGYTSPGAGPSTLKFVDTLNGISTNVSLTAGSSTTGYYGGDLGTLWVFGTNTNAFYLDLPSVGQTYSGGVCTLDSPCYGSPNVTEISNGSIYKAQSGTITLASVTPEPSSLLLLVTGLIGTGVSLRRRRTPAPTQTQTVATRTMLLSVGIVGLRNVGNPPYSLREVCR